MMPCPWTPRWPACGPGADGLDLLLHGGGQRDEVVDLPVEVVLGEVAPLGDGAGRARDHDLLDLRAGVVVGGLGQEDEVVFAHVLPRRFRWIWKISLRSSLDGRSTKKT